MDDKQWMNENDVVSVSESDRIIVGNTTFKIIEILQQLKYFMDQSQGQQDRTQKWFINGVDCELLSPNNNSGWKKGKVKFCLEFVPDAPESPLDDIRKGITDNS